jgi:transcriptional regulator with XRE-family HTH domain
MTQAELARRLGVSRSAVAQWERKSGSNPVASNLQKLACALDCSFEWLATGRGARQAIKANGEDAATAAMLRHFARDEAEDQLLLLFRGLDPRDQGVLLTVADSLCGSPAKGRKR